MNLTAHFRRFLDTGEPDLALLACLADLVRERLHKSGMWHQPPEYFGYPEYHSWQEAFSPDDPSPGPVGDFFLEEIVPEQTFLDQTIRAGNGVEALLRQKVKWFLIDRQKKHDPIGYRAFMNLIAVLEAMATDGAATVTNRIRGKIRNPTIIRLAAGTPAPVAESELAPVIDADADWQPVLLRLGKLGKGAQRLLRERLERFPSAGVAAFSAGELGVVLKARARAAREAWNRPTQGSSLSPSQEKGDPDPFRTDSADERYPDSEERLTALGIEVREAIEKSDYTPKVKRGMIVVLADWLEYLKAGNSHPPLREWAPQLGLTRSSLGDYQQRLRPLLRATLEKGPTG